MKKKWSATFISNRWHVLKVLKQVSQNYNSQRTQVPPSFLSFSLKAFNGLRKIRSSINWFEYIYSIKGRIYIILKNSLASIQSCPPGLWPFLFNFFCFLSKRINLESMYITSVCWRRNRPATPYPQSRCIALGPGRSRSELSHKQQTLCQTQGFQKKSVVLHVQKNTCKWSVLENRGKNKQTAK